jgi:enoyl-CoA hydratase/carnithine racemase
VTARTGASSPGQPIASPAGAPLLVGQRDDVRWLRLNRPERRNALSPALVTALDAAIAEASDDPGTRIVVITGEGPSFCAGADLRHLRTVAEDGNDPTAFLAATSRCFTRLERCPKPVVAAVHGHVVAGGLELALACDVVVAREDTLIGDGHVRNGLLPAGGGSVRLSRKVGEPLARWLSLTGQLLPAEEFIASGFIHAIASAEQFDDLIAAVIDALRAPHRTAQTRMKQLLAEGEAADPAALARELDTFTRHWHGNDIAGELRAFFDRTNDRTNNRRERR